MRRLVLPVLLFAATSLSALEFFPPAPDSHTGVRIRFLAANCAPTARATVSGTTITLSSTTTLGYACLAAFVPSFAVADAGVLAPGVYDVRGEVGNERGTLIVRDAGAGFVVSPVGLSSEAKRTVQIFTDRPFVPPATVTFDGTPATASVSSDGLTLVATPPAHAVGTVDVTVTDGAGTRTAVAAFTYFDPSAPPDPAVFEPVLFPIAYSGPGVFGSQWRTENQIGTGNALVRFRELLKVEACNGACGAFNWSAILSDPATSGRLLWVVRRRVPGGLSIEDDFRVSSRILESLHPDEVNTTLPVVREKDFRNKVVIERVPVGKDARVTVRVYAVADAARTASVTVDRGGDVSSTFLELKPANGIAFGTLDIGPNDLHPRTEPATITVVSSAKIWGLVTLTDNETQKVISFWPQ